MGSGQRCAPHTAYRQPDQVALGNFQFVQQRQVLVDQAVHVDGRGRRSIGAAVAPQLGNDDAEVC
ncbi:hypothetical protein D3C79_981120 [compost metagenome]